MATLCLPVASSFRTGLPLFAITNGPSRATIRLGLQATPGHRIFKVADA